MNHNIISGFAGELATIRHDLHMHPEVCFEEFRTAKIVAGELMRLGFTVMAGVALDAFPASEQDTACCEQKGAVPLDVEILGAGVGFGIRKEDTELLAKINAGIKAMADKGAFAPITSK